MKVVKTLAEAWEVLIAKTLNEVKEATIVETKIWAELPWRALAGEVALAEAWEVLAVATEKILVETLEVAGE